MTRPGRVRRFGTAALLGVVAAMALGRDSEAQEALGALAARIAARKAMVRIPAGSYLPLYTAGGRTDLRVGVGAFALDARPVTRGEYAAFEALHPEWRRSRLAGSRAGAGYLAGWRGDLDFGGAADAARPVTEVPLAAAQAYCSAEGKRLPTTDEWEYVAAASPERRDASGDAAFKQRLLELYTRPRPAQPAPVGSIFRNAFGVWDLHGLVWEWTVQAAQNDHAARHAKAHGAGATKHDMGCAGSAAGASDTRSYAAFLRYAFREGLTPGSTTSSLGFRCAR